MKRRLGIAGAVLAALAALLLWWWHGGPRGADGTSAASTIGTATTGLAPQLRHQDPRKLDRASVEGTIMDDDHAPIAHARVCVDLASNDLPDELQRDPHCTFADDRGHYLIGDLFASEITVGAMARPYIPAIYHPDGDRHRTELTLHAGEHRTGVDLVLEKGGVEITGTVSDIAGGPIAHALVRASTGWWGGDDGNLPAIETDDAGKFTMWVRPGSIAVTASVDGYSDGNEWGHAPGKFEILMTPESSLSGVVVDAKTNAPVPGVHVTVSGDGQGTTITNEQGSFHVDRLEPGRYTATATSAAGYGESDGSMRVGLAQHVSGMIVKLYPAVRIEGRVVIPDEKKSTCKDSSLSLSSREPARNLQAQRDPDGTLHVDGVLPGNYEVEIECRGFRARDKYAHLVVASKDLMGLEWQVDDGALIRGRVLTKSGAPVERASVSASAKGAAAREVTGGASDTSARDGTYKLEALKPGTYTINVHGEHGIAPKDGWKVTVQSPGAVVDQDLVLDEGGTIHGTVVDADGKPMPGVHVRAQAIANDFEWSPGGSVRSGDDGSFELDNLRPGDYRVIGSRSSWGWGTGEMRKPGTDDDAKQGERTTVRASQISSVRLVVEATSGVIHGRVEDADGKPVTDAFVVASRESDAAGSQPSNIEATRWSSDDHPVLTATDGTFTVAKLSPGTYTLLAERKGGGEVVSEHVALGSTAVLRIKPTGSIEGTVHRDGGAPEELTVSLNDVATGLSRSEHFFRSGGSYAVHDLPAGHFTITYSAEGGEKQQTIDLSEGEHKTGVDIELDPLVTLTGRVVGLGTQQPALGIMVMVSAGKTSDWSFVGGGDEDHQNITDESGRFTVQHAPRGTVTMMGFPSDWKESDYGFFRTVREVQGTGTIDVGDIAVVHRRVKPGDPVGEIGVHWAEQAPATPIDQQVYKVSWLDPAGPAAKTELKVGDIVTTVDGNDVSGSNSANGWMLMQAAPGTTIKLGLARGITVAITLAPPS
jgi:protocatechuate 3,4-dioxygenase beta subunit